ncbi:MAG: ribbon-helix-helix domain-containing protein [Alphaproteobacteria bacterium]|nr:ribbon-helix-helix domain-containing protein [Alphaproteobacteria bacterium]
MQNATQRLADYDGDEGLGEPKTTLVSRNITVQGRRTSVRLEPEMWTALREIAAQEFCSIHDICTLISLRKKEKTSLTAAIRVFIMLYFRAATTDEGHRRAGHGDFETMKKRARIPEQLANMFSDTKRKKRSSYGFGYQNYASNGGVVTQQQAYL